MPLPGPGLAEFVGGGPGDAGQFAKPLRVVAEPAAEASTRPSIVASNSKRVPSPSRWTCRQTRPVKLAEGDCGDLVDAVSVVAADQVLGHGQG